MDLKIYIKTLGCDKNICDSDYVAGLLASEGHRITDDPAKADIMLVNTCGFIKDAKVQSIESIFELAAIKKDKQRLFVSGCLSQRYGAELAKEIPELDAVLGVNDYNRLPEIIKSEEREILTSKAPRCYEEFGSRKLLEKSYTASVKISEGCTNVCTYCAIPFIRGGYRSRKPEDILSEVKMLAGSGVKEIQIVAQDTTAYGKDIKGWSLAKLLKKICKVDGIEWVRLLYCYEDEITDELIQTIKSEKKIVKYIDIPLQHYSDRILKAMNRKSTPKSIESTIARLRKEIPGIRIRTTFIVGFPGETKTDFKALYDFVERARFDRMGVFTYSKEEGTRAAKMPSQVKEDAKQRRLDKLMELQRSISLEHNEELVGKTMRVIVTEEDSPGVYIGRTEFDAPDIDNEVIFTSRKKLKPGAFADVLVTGAFDY
ncbi:MAG: 30S ribosomal protein S12 methylthiotransferase RimO, partial [Firmicutes bacterium]|nr:30S ribosomal protein S12 methylthiotransferase RimO [Bacillota bacterium]